MIKQDFVDMTQKENEEKHTIDDWCKRHGYKMLDPDGFDRTDPKLFERKFTLEEFRRGLFCSTIEFCPLKSGLSRALEVANV